MSKQNKGFGNLNYLILIFCFFSFSILYSQIDYSKIKNDKKFNGNILNTETQGNYLEETKVFTKNTDTITFLFDNETIAKLITIKNEAVGITNAQFHKYAKDINQKFRFHSKLENGNSIVYFNEEKNLVNIKIFSDNSQSKLIQLVFISGQKMIEKIIPDLKSIYSSNGFKQ